MHDAVVWSFFVLYVHNVMRLRNLEKRFVTTYRMKEKRNFPFTACFELCAHVNIKICEI